jgi:hypothetical protein
VDAITALHARQNTQNITAVQNKWDLDRGCRFEAGLKAKEAFEVGKVPSFFL